MGIKENRQRRKKLRQERRESQQVKNKLGIDILDVDLDGDGDKERILVKGATKKEKRLAHTKGVIKGWTMGRLFQPIVDFFKSGMGSKLLNAIKAFF